MIFYVYEHWRPDKDLCFYVGKGQRRRAYKMSRGETQHGRVLKKLARLGLAAEVRIVQGGLSEEAAFALERERIAFWREVGVKLTNATDGGDGWSGRKHSKKTRLQISKAKRGVPSHRKGVVLSQETIEKMRQANLGKVMPQAIREKIRAANKGKQKPVGFGFGKVLTMEHREKIRQSLLNRTRS